MAKAIKVITESGSVTLKGADLEAYKALEEYCAGYAVNRPIGSSEKPRLVESPAYGYTTNSFHGPHVVRNCDERRDCIPGTLFSTRDIAGGALAKILRGW